MSGFRGLGALAVMIALLGCHRSGHGQPPMGTQAAIGSREPSVPSPALPVDEPAPWSEAWLAREGRRFISDTAYRRAALVASLANPRNTYSQLRLGSYALGQSGWDLLPVWNPRSRPVTAALTTALAHGERPQISTTDPPLWDGQTPTSLPAWVALGRRVFFEYPLRADVYIEYGLTRPALAAAVGIERTALGEVPGVVVFANVDGQTRVGITCAICHASVKDGEVIAGIARRHFDYGRLQLAFDADPGRGSVLAANPQQARKMASWGPGRADVTEDDDADPVTIPDLWGLREQTALTHAGTIIHHSPLALAIRQETQLLSSNHQRIRPPRELAWALAMYLYSLKPKVTAPETATSAAQVARGATLFAANCRSCHDNAAYGGSPMPAAQIGTDPALATGHARGTGTYRTSPLLRVGSAAPYLHHGAVASLQELLSPARLAPSYTAGILGPGPIPGHTAGTDLGAADRAALIEFLNTL